MPPESEIHSHKLLWILGALLLIAAAAYGVQRYVSMSGSYAPGDLNSFTRENEVWIPNPGLEDTVQAQRGFDYLVSYTGERFEPSLITIQRGERVRLTNNSASPLTLEGEGITIEPLRYAETPFTKPGEFRFIGNGAPLTIIVE